MKFPLEDVNVSFDLLKIAPTIYFYRQIVSTFVDILYPLSHMLNFKPEIDKDNWLMGRRQTSRLRCAFCAPIATATLIMFIQKVFFSGINFSFNEMETIYLVLSQSIPGTEDAVVDVGTNSLAQKAYILLFLSKKLNSLYLKLKQMSIGQLIKFIFKTLSSLLLILFFINYIVDPKGILPYFAKITLYDLAKI